MRKSSYQQRLFLLVLLFAGVLTVCFFTFQHRREKFYKTEQLNARLQLLNTRIAYDRRNGDTPQTLYERYASQFAGLRLTLIDTTGRVCYDSERQETATPLSNHLSRSEVAEALAHSTGHTIRRLSESTDREYFYSALREGEMIIRTALPYDWSLHATLSIDNRYVWYMILITALAVGLGYWITYRLSANILRLRLFTEMLDRGEDVSDFAPFPEDELGEISNHIVSLYGQLQHTAANLEREQAFALKEEQEKIRIKRQLTNNISHELKTPVSAIRGYLESILNTPHMEESLRQSFLEKSYAQTERLQQLLQDIALVTRMEEAPRMIERSEIDMRPLIDDVVEQARQQCGGETALQCRLPERLPIFGNASLLYSIFHNLTANALAYSGGSIVRIELLDETAEGYRFLFADNGSGVDPIHLERLFERFYRIDKGRSRKLGGTGLGLSIVKNAVLFHGGTIEARNGEAGGLEFWFTLAKHAI